MDVSKINGLNIKDSNARESINQLSNELEETNENVNEENINNIRKKFYNRYHLFEYPVNLPSFFDVLKIYESNDKKNYKYNIDIESLKNTGGTTYYVDRGSDPAIRWQDDTGTGTQEDPCKTIRRALAYAQDGDTIIVKSNIYYRNQMPSSNTDITHKNINVICEENTLFVSGDYQTFTQNELYSNVYQVNRTNGLRVIDIRGRKKNIFSELTKVDSLEEVSNKLNSYYYDNTTFYINIGEVVTSDKVAITLKLNWNAFNIRSNVQNINFYLENATIINGSSSMVRVVNDSGFIPTFIAKNCKFLYLSNTDSYNGIDLRGCNSILIGCEASHNGNDGFNYHSANDIVCNAIELDCIGSNNGLGRTYPHTFNGSTIHDGSKIVRLNGVYFNNRGGNVADVNEESVSININCMAFDSDVEAETLYSSDFNAQQAGATMYLYNCFAKGKSTHNLWIHEEATMYVSNCSYDRVTGNINEI